jgi:hypothetical protein
MQAYLIYVETYEGWIETAFYIPNAAVITPHTQKVAPTTSHSEGIQEEFEKTALNELFSADPGFIALAHDMVFGGPGARDCYGYSVEGPIEIPGGIVERIAALSQAYLTSKGTPIPQDVRQDIDRESKLLMGLASLVHN